MTRAPRSLNWRRREREESSYRARAPHGATFYRSRRTVDGLGVFVKRFPGSSGARQFVLVHGIGVSSRYFHPLAAVLAAHGTVWLLDLPGYGAAPNPHRDVSITDHASAVAAFMDGAGIRSAVVVGHSMGSNVVSALAEARPELVERLVLMAPTMAPEDRTPGRAIGKLARDFLSESWRVRIVAIGDYVIRCGPPYLFAQLPHLLGDRIEQRLPQLAMPVVVITGDRDPIVPNAWAAACAALAPRGRLALVRGPHVIMQTDPRESADAIVGDPASPPTDRAD